jgi:hypothetical protein
MKKTYNEEIINNGYTPINDFLTINKPYVLMSNEGYLTSVRLSNFRISNYRTNTFFSTFNIFIHRNSYIYIYIYKK